MQPTSSTARDNHTNCVHTGHWLATNTQVHGVIFQCTGICVCIGSSGVVFKNSHATSPSAVVYNVCLRAIPDNNVSTSVVLLGVLVWQVVRNAYHIVGASWKGTLRRNTTLLQCADCGVQIPDEQLCFVTCVKCGHKPSVGHLEHRPVP